MEIQTQLPLHDKNGLAQHLQGLFPQYKVAPNMHGVIVGDGLATGVLVRDLGNGRAKLMWEFPNMGVKILTILTIPFTGILPGLIIFGLVWMVTKGDVDRMLHEVSGALMSGAMPQPGAMGGYAGGPAAARSSGGRGMAVAFGILTLLAGGFTAYHYSEYQSSSSYSSYNRYGRYGSYGSGYGSSYDYSYYRRRDHRQAYQAGSVATLFCLVMTVIGLARGKGNTQPMPMQQPGMPYGQPMGSQQGYPSQPGPYGQPMGPQQGYGSPSQVPQQPGPFGQPMASQQGGYPSQPTFGQPQGMPQSGPSPFGQPGQLPQQQGWGPGAPPNQGQGQGNGGWGPTG